MQTTTITKSKPLFNLDRLKARDLSLARALPLVLSLSVSLSLLLSFSRSHSFPLSLFPYISIYLSLFLFLFLSRSLIMCVFVSLCIHTYIIYVTHKIYAHINMSYICIYYIMHVHIL